MSAGSGSSSSHSGAIYNQMRLTMKQGNAHVIFVLNSRYQSGADVCTTEKIWRQNCGCFGAYKAAIERSRILARDLFAPEKPYN
jgi:hypothetical protein